jgi:hypothetical protein
MVRQEIAGKNDRGCPSVVEQDRRGYAWRRLNLRSILTDRLHSSGSVVRPTQHRREVASLDQF